MENDAQEQNRRPEADPIVAEAKDLADWMKQPRPDTDARRQAREASMRAMATKLMTGTQTD
jgi:hypothetical protein